MKRFDLELVVGIFVLAGLICLGLPFHSFGQDGGHGGGGYDLYAKLPNTGGLKKGR